jgi:hypothetical protein
LHPLQSKRAILLASMKELLELAAFYGDQFERTQNPDSMKRHKYFTLEAYRLGMRLLQVQKKIEDEDLD